MSAKEWRSVPNDSLSIVELILVDVDGCLTDGGKYITDDGGVSLRYSAVDGLGLWLLSLSGVRVVLISSSTHSSIDARGADLDVFRCYQGVADKAEVARALLVELGLTADNLCVVGDDLWDLSAMRIARISVCPRDARPEVVDAASYVTEARGGHGSIREIADGMLRSRGLSTADLQGLLER